MKERSFSEIVREFLPLLRKQEKDENLEILEAEETPGSNPGFEKSFITKRHPVDSGLVAFARTADLFRNEAYVYEKLLPLFGSDSFGPECIYADSEKIIMKDLSLERFAICERRTLLDLQHCQVVIQTLASFHAKSLSVKLKDPLRFQEVMKPMKEVVFPTDSRPAVGQSINRAVGEAIQSLESSQPIKKENEEAIEFLKKYENNAYDIMQKFMAKHEKYHVLTHGDVWNNNILFADDFGSKESLRVKFVDFQAAREASIATDFQYFIYSNSEISVLEENYEDLVKLYHHSFIQNLRQLQVPEEDCRSLTLDWLRDELREYALYGLFSALNLVHAILARDKMIITTSENDQEMCSDVSITPEKTERIGYLVSHYIRTHFCDR